MTKKYQNLIAPPCLKRGPEAGENHKIDFHGLGVNIMVHARFNRADYSFFNRLRIS